MKKFVIVPTPEISEAVQKLLFAKGFRWDDNHPNSVQNTKEYCLYLYDDGTICYSAEYYIPTARKDGWSEISLHELSKIDVREPIIKIGNYNVIFDNSGNSIKANNVTFTYELVQQIIAQMKGQ